MGLSTGQDQLVTQGQIDFFQENGFIQMDGLLTPKETKELQQFIDEAMSVEGKGIKTDTAAGSYYKVLNQKVNTWRDHAGMAKYVTHPRITEIARRLAQVSGIRLFHDHALWKMPEDSKPTPWHQDFSYWPMDTDGAKTLSIWIALDDVDEHNGCMMFVPGSQKVGKLTGIDLINPVDINQYVEDEDIKNTKPVICRMKAGSATFHTGLTFHYAHPNMSTKPRRALAIIYMPADTPYNGANHVMTDGLGLEKGQTLSGPYFPILAGE